MTLTNIISESSRILQGDRIPSTYLMDKSTKSLSLHAVAYPINTEEVVGLVKYASKHDLAIITYGANTGLAEATLAFGGELIIDLSKMNRIVDFDLNTLTLTVEPGVTNGEVQQYVESRGYFYPPDPGAKHGSIGGNVATNAGGMRAVKYGTTRDFVRKMEVVLANGDVIETGSIAIKNSSGYNLNHLFIGSEGTLGIITKIYLKIIPLPKYKQSYIAAFPTLDTAAEAVQAILREGLDITAVEFFERRAIAFSERLLNKTFPSDKGVAYLLMTLDGVHEAVIEEEAKLLEEITASNQAVEFITLSPEDSITAWLLRDNILAGILEISEQEPLDYSVPVNEFVNFFKYTHEVEQNSGLSFISFGHAGDGNIHSSILRGELNDEEWKVAKHDILTNLYAYVAKVGGLPSAEHGIGLVKKPYFKQVMQPEYMHYLKQVKLAFDPENRLNPGKIFD